MKIRYLTNDGIPFGIELIAVRGKYDKKIIDEFRKGVKVVDLNEENRIRLIVKELIKDEKEKVNIWQKKTKK